VPVIEVNGLTKTFKSYKKLPGLQGAFRGLFHRKYDETVAVKGIHFKVEEGELVGFLGPNGAGKTTTLKMLSGLLHPTSGNATVLGYRPWERADGYRRQFALLLGQKNQLWWDLPARESLALNARIYGIAQREFDQTVSELTEMLRVRDKLDVMVRELSLGERMKMELIASLLHQPKVLFLDEPTIGLDVVSQKIVREFLKAHNRQHKTTLLLTSHYMADIEALCERVIIIDHGVIVFDGKLGEIVDRFADSKVVSIRCPDPESTEIQWLQQWGEVLQRGDGEIRLKVKRDGVITACKALLERLEATDIDIEETPIEDVIRELFSGDKGT
jgi:ABC-2 type transport system ATP-binding protein